MKIAVMISGLIFDSQKATMKGIERKVREYKDVAEVFCCHMNVAPNEEYSKGEYEIFNLPDYDSFDGFVFVGNTIPDNDILKNICEKILKTGKPCVSIDYYCKDFVSLTTDEAGSMEVLTEHMITEHDCKKFYFVQGSASGSDNRLRYEGFQKILKKYNLPFKEEWSYCGNYEFSAGQAAVDYFLGLEEDMADVIICANDQMAAGAYMELKKKGLKVPRDVKVTGVDYDFVSRVITPKITTVKRQQYQKGLTSVDILHHYEEYRAGDNIVSPIQISIGETCGCKGIEENHADVKDALAIDRYKQAELTKMVKRMSTAILSKSTNREVFDIIREYTAKLNPEELYLVLNKEKEIKLDYASFSEDRLQEMDLDSEKYTDEVFSVLACKDGHILNEFAQNSSFKRRDLLPPKASGGRLGATYYFFPLHFINRNFGYAILGDSGELVRNDFFPNWTNIVANAFENLRKRDLLTKMINTLEGMWIYDTLTGIYNRAGFFKLSEKIIEEALKNNEALCIIFMDVDGLKAINDQYGHDAGDKLIKDMAEVLKKIKRHGEIVMRYGGDEFVLMAKGYDDSEAVKCIGKIEEEMKKINELGENPFILDASIGYSIARINSKDEISSMIENADQEMYKRKYVKKAKKLEESKKP